MFGMSIAEQMPAPRMSRWRDQSNRRVVDARRLK
jgi:hypothetical protein